jgi:hypothetical protein
MGPTALCLVQGGQSCAASDRCLREGAGRYFQAGYSLVIKQRNKPNETNEWLS